MRNCIRLLWIPLLPVLTACASYYSHYGSLTVETPTGKARQAVISWESEEGIGGVNTTPIRLETQCSERVLVFRDPTHATECQKAGDSGIVWCGDPLQDLNGSGQAVAPGTVCGQITDGGKAGQVGELGNRLQVTISCWPSEATVGQGDDSINLEYPRASTVPYQFVVKKVTRGSPEDRKPVPSIKACKDD